MGLQLWYLRSFFFLIEDTNYKHINFNRNKDQMCISLQLFLHFFNTKIMMLWNTVLKWIIY